MSYIELLQKHPIISDQIAKAALSVVLRELEQILVQKVTGDIVEFGCYTGTTTLFLRRLLDQTGESTVRQLHVYDSFAGLPEKTIADLSATGIDFKAGELSISKKQFLREFQKAQLQAPVTHKAWFKDLQAKDLPGHIAYAFLDGDFYRSIIESLRLVWPRLSPGGAITIDDYQRGTLPGVEQAVTDFFQGKAVRVHHEQHIAIIKPA